MRIIIGKMNELYDIALLDECLVQRRRSGRHGSTFIIQSI